MPLDAFFKDGTLSKDDFYTRLLELGKAQDKQYLLPVAFNIPVLVYARSNSSRMSNPFTVSLEEIKRLGKDYNRLESNGMYSRMGFSPTWDGAFLLVMATLFDVSFTEGAPLTWDEVALDRMIWYIQDWIQEANTSIQAEDDFAFKYLYDPPAKLALSGRILFTYMDSAKFFTLGEEQRTNFDFRWIGAEDRIPLSDESVYYGIYRKAKAKKAAAAFTQWFFQADTQRLLLEVSRDKQIDETLFGIGNGFSAIRTVTERIFPQFYPGLLGHMPPEDFLSPANILPRDWAALKERVVIPYLRKWIRRSADAPTQSLEGRIRDWYKGASKNFSF
jgi:hypothetical protein